MENLENNIDTEFYQKISIKYITNNQLDYQLSKPYRIPTKISLGIACCRINTYKKLHRVPEILLIKKRYTYAFSDFVHGKYESSENRKQLADLFNKMTIDEKLLILGMDFEQMWFRIWLKSEQDITFIRSKHKFESIFAVDKGEKLKKIISKSKNIIISWEIPKGRKKSKNESEINCAIREFSEETKIAKRLYNIFPNAKKDISYIDNRVCYYQKYFIAGTIYNFEPTININDKGQISEVNEVQWMNIDQIRACDQFNRLEPIIRPIFRYIKKRMR